MAYLALASWARRGWKLDENLPPGYSADFMLGALLVGSALVLSDAFFSYREYVAPRDAEDRGDEAH